MLQSDDILLHDLRRVARHLGVRRLSCRAYETIGRFRGDIHRRRFGSWTAALQRAGLRPASARLTIEELHLNMYALWRRFRGKPSVENVTRQISDAAWNAYVRRFGSWHRAQTAFTRWIRRPANRSKAHRAWVRRERERRHTSRLIASRRDRSQATNQRAARASRVPRAVSPIVTLTMRYQVLRRDRYRCRACGRSPANDPKVELHVDHRRPAAKGGGLGGPALRNLQTLCRDCNLGKRDTT